MSNLQIGKLSLLQFCAREQSQFKFRVSIKAEGRKPSGFRHRTARAVPLPSGTYYGTIPKLPVRDKSICFGGF